MAFKWYILCKKYMAFKGKNYMAFKGYILCKKYYARFVRGKEGENCS